MTILTKDYVLLKLKRVIDPEVGMNIVDLGLIYDVKINDGQVIVDITMTTPGCPMEGYITGETQGVLASLPEIEQASVEVVWDPPWSPEKINPLALKVREIPDEKIKILDVRPILSKGGEPFGLIMKEIKTTSDNGALKLIAPFKPAPLFNVLAAQGWTHYIESEIDNDWTIWFIKDGPNKTTDSGKNNEIKTNIEQIYNENSVLRERLSVNGNIWRLDVRTMVPPEPMELTLFVLDRLPEDCSLVQVNERTPQFLFELLTERGFTYETVTQSDSEVATTIRRK